jgi:hypothetical protein
MAIEKNADAVKNNIKNIRAEFELTEDEKQKFKSSSPTTDQIKNSINLITNSDKGG